jgi:hypothetical protein
MIKLSALHPSRLSAGALFLTTALAGCSALGSVPAGSTPLATSATVASPGAATVAPTQRPTAALSSTALPEAQPNTSAPTAAAAASGEDSAAAIQTVLDYYDAINQRTYDRAYHLWARDGAASNQTFDQFKQGFANTVEVSVQLRAASVRPGTISVPITIAAVVNLPDNASQGQQVQHFRGTYTVQPSQNGWQIASAGIAETHGDIWPPADVGDPLILLQSYYAAINDRDFARAYTYWNNNGAASQQTFTQFSQGFATTDHVVIAAGRPESEGAAGSIFANVPIVIVATQTDGGQQTFCGIYTLRRLDVPPFDQLGWRIEHAAIAQGASVQLGSDQARRLLTNGCKP